MSEIDPLSVPAVMPASVPRTTSQGYPTKFQLDWEQATQSWFVNTSVDLQTKVTTLEADLGDVEASIVTEASIRETEDGILATQITTVSAVANTASTNATAGISLAVSAQNTANNATATGQVYLAAKAGPSGSTAAYGWYITSGSAFAGMEALALSSGGSAIGFAADKFYFTDSGTAQQVLDYNGSAFVFQVPIVIRNASTGERQEITSSNTKIYDSAGTLRVAIGVGI